MLSLWNCLKTEFTLILNLTCRSDLSVIKNIHSCGEKFLSCSQNDTRKIHCMKRGTLSSYNISSMNMYCIKCNRIRHTSQLKLFLSWKLSYAKMVYSFAPFHCFWNLSWIYFLLFLSLALSLCIRPSIWDESLTSALILKLPDDS